MVQTELHLQISFRMLPLRNVELIWKFYQRFKSFMMSIHMKNNKFVMPCQKKVLIQTHTFADKDRTETDSTLLYKELLLPKKLAMMVKIKRFLNINKETISVKLLWLKILLDRQVSKQRLIRESSQLTEKPLKDYQVPLKIF